MDKIPGQELAEALDRDGYAIRENVVFPAEIQTLAEAVSRRLNQASALLRGEETYGMRDMLRAVPEVRRLAGSAPLIDLAESILGPGAYAVRGLWFDKTDGANWGVPWHQDTTITVHTRVETAGYGPWTLKLGMDHVRPPVSVLDAMVTLRLHLDDCDADNGPLRVIPGSHRGGLWDAGATREWVERDQAVSCLTGQGGVVMMRPLILHASSAALTPRHRRVLHLEYAAQPLADGLNWFECVGRVDS